MQIKFSKDHPSIGDMALIERLQRGPDIGVALALMVARNEEGDFPMTEVCHLGQDQFSVLLTELFVNLRIGMLGAVVQAQLADLNLDPDL
jgi:hypothetical protein